MLDTFGDLPNWPGRTPPKNRKPSGKVRPAEDALNGAKSKVYRINGVDREFFTIGEVARALGKQPVTLRMWENRGWLPRVKYRTPAPAAQQLPGKPSKGRRLYSREQVEFLLEASQRFQIDNSKSSDWDGFRQYIRANWPTS